MKELTQAQKAQAFDLWIAFKEAGHSDWLTEKEFTSLCCGLGKEINYAEVARRIKGEARIDLMSAVKYVVAAPHMTATITKYIPNCDNCGCKYYDMIDGMAFCHECLKVAK